MNESHLLSGSFSFKVSICEWMKAELNWARLFLCTAESQQHFRLREKKRQKKTHDRCFHIKCLFVRGEECKCVCVCLGKGEWMRRSGRTDGGSNRVPVKGAFLMVQSRQFCLHFLFWAKPTTTTWRHTEPHKRTTKQIMNRALTNQPASEPTKD